MPHFVFQDVNDAFTHLLYAFARGVLLHGDLILLDQNGRERGISSNRLAGALTEPSTLLARSYSGILGVRDKNRLEKVHRFGSMTFAWQVWHKRQPSGHYIARVNSTTSPSEDEDCFEMTETRNGLAVSYAEPVTISYTQPSVRTLKNIYRNCNPFFHLAEAFWMIAGRDDVASLSFFVNRMKEYSDNGVTFHGAYGARWRDTQGIDQVEQVIRTLKSQSSSRRVYISHWLPSRDSVLMDVPHTRDLPCNVGIAFRVNLGCLDMTVFNRSNDVLWGALGANYVHFGFLQQYIANQLGVRVGKYHQISNNLHLYLDSVKNFEELITSESTLRRHPLSCLETEYSTFGREHYFEERVDQCFENLIYNGKKSVDGENYRLLFPDGDHTAGDVCGVLVPVIKAYRLYKQKKLDEAIEIAKQIQWSEWREECVAWLSRKQSKIKATMDVLGDLSDPTGNSTPRPMISDSEGT